MPADGVNRIHWHGWLSPSELLAAVQMCGRELVRHHREFSDRVRTLLGRGLKYDHIRVPCDLRRFGVTTVPWCPYGLIDADIKSTGGLVGAIRNVLDLQRNTMGMLMDVNIFWRVLRLVYCTQYVSCNIRGELAECVPVLGIWHAYAHSLKKVYDHFLPLIATLEIPGFLKYPEYSTVYCKPRVIVMEHMMMGLFLAGPAVQGDIRAALTEVTAEYGDDSEQADQLRGLLYLITEYAPAIVEMGISVRQCFWATQDTNTGKVAKQVLMDAIVLLQSLCGGGTTEYIRNLMMMVVMWSDLHSAMPAALFVEECLESSLSVLSRRTRTDTRATSLKDFSDIYGRAVTYTIKKKTYFFLK